MRLYHPDMATLARLLTALLRRTPPVGEPLSDAELLARFADARDAAAFELLVWRHGAMVLGVCRRVLRHEQSAEDAFQAVFLILAKKAGGVRTQLAGYLHTTARRVCLRMAKRTAFAVLETEPPAAVPPDALANAELAALLDAEIARLPEKFRLAVVLCYLRGLTTERAAEQLKVPRGTVLSRLASARKRLVERLTAKGVTVPTAFLTTAITTGELAADVCGRTATLALGFVTSTLPVTIPSQLATEVLSMMTHKTALAVAVAVVLMTGVGTGLGWVLADGERPGDAPKPAAKAEQPKAKPLEDDPNADREKKRLAEQRALLGALVQEAQLRYRQRGEELRKKNQEAGTPASRKASEELMVEVAKQVFAAEAALAESKFELEEADNAYMPIRTRKAEWEKAKTEHVALAKQHDAATDEAKAARAEADKMAKELLPFAPRLQEALVKAAKSEEKAAELDRARQSLFQKQQRLLYPPDIRYVPKGGRAPGGAGGRMEFTSPEIDKKLAEEEGKQLVVERCESAVRVKQSKLAYLVKRQAELQDRLANVPETKLLEAELDIHLAQMRTLSELLLAVELQQKGIAVPAPDAIRKELEDLRREVKKLQAERK